MNGQAPERCPRVAEPPAHNGGGGPLAQRDARTGKWLPGSTGNPRGRARGSKNRRTQVVDSILKRSAARAARALVDQLRSPLPWLSLAAAKTILERAAPLLEAERERSDGDTKWIEHATAEELDAVRAIRDRCRARRGDAFDAQSLPPAAEQLALPRPALEPERDELVIDVVAQVVSE
jgi:hypothetical protein